MACTRCGGSGKMLEHIHHEGGVCFRCKGSGVDPKQTNPVRSGKIHKETVIAGKKVVLTTIRDPRGRFKEYNVYVEGSNYVVRSKNIKEANTAYQTLKKRQVLAVK